MAANLASRAAPAAHARLGGRCGAQPLPKSIYFIDRPWGERSFYVTDRWGNELCFVEDGTLFT